jgi:hypothetical protein
MDAYFISPVCNAKLCSKREANDQATEQSLSLNFLRMLSGVLVNSKLNKIRI